MKYKVRLTCLVTPWRFNYSEAMVVFSVARDSVEVWATLEDAAYLQRINTQHKVEILYEAENVWFPLWFFREYEEHLREGQIMASNFYTYLLSKERVPYEPAYHIVDQAPAFIYQPSERFKQKLRERKQDKWFPGWRQLGTEPLTVSKLQEYLTDIFITRNRSGKETRQIKIGIYCPHVGHWITVGPDYWPCSECYYERVGKHLHEQAQNYLKADKYYGKTNKA